MIPLIALEEHFYSQSIFDSLDARGSALFKQYPAFLEQLRDVEGQRLSSMDGNGVALQVISHAWQTGGASLEACRAGNDELASRIAQHKNRFAAFAVLPVANAQESAVELKRTVHEHGFVGALIDNHVNGAFFDGSAYDELWKMAEDLDVPIYIHPTLTPETAVQEHYSGNYSAGTAFSLSAESWGWHSDTGLHILRLFSAGVFDRYPKLKLIIGHFGEMLPYMLERCQYFSSRWSKTQRLLTDVWEQNIYITTSGVWSLNPMRCLLKNTKIEHILFSVDWPFSTNEQGRQWFEDLERSGLLSQEQLEMVAFRNAEVLLKVKAESRDGATGVV